MNKEHTFEITIEEVNDADASIYANELREAILNSSPEVSAEIVKDDPNSQDFGATIIMVLGAPAVVIVARGIAKYIESRGKTIRIIRKADGSSEVVATGLDGQDQSKIAKAFEPKE